jgi:plasmid stabilization system protein ParE
MRVVVSDLAERDLEEIGDHIAADNPDRAVSFVRELRRRCMALGDTPMADPLREEFGRGVRLLVHRRYLVLYRVSAGVVSIERVRHGARNVIVLLRPADDA